MEQEKNFEEEIEYIEEEYITLEMEDGTLLECVILAIFPVDDKSYIALYPEGDIDEENEGVFLYEYVENGEESELLSIEDDDVYEKVIVAFEAFMEEFEADDEHDEDCDC